MKKLLTALFIICLSCCLTGCAELLSDYNSLKGSITGNTYRCEFYSNSGEKFMTVKGQNIDLNSTSSILVLTIDGHQVESCGSTILFIEEGLEPDVDFKLESVESVESYADEDDIGDYTFVANIVNRWKNSYGKPVVAVIQSQLGDPICAFSGNEVYWEVCSGLDKTTKLMIDGKALYIHRANFQLIDTELLNGEIKNSSSFSLEEVAEKMNLEKNSIVEERYSEPVKDPVYQ